MCVYVMTNAHKLPTCTLKLSAGASLVFVAHKQCLLHKHRFLPHWHIPHNKGAPLQLRRLGGHCSTGVPRPGWYAAAKCCHAAPPQLLTWHLSRGPGDVCVCVWGSVGERVCEFRVGPDCEWRPFSDLYYRIWNGWANQKCVRRRPAPRGTRLKLQFHCVCLLGQLLLLLWRM